MTAYAVLLTGAVFYATILLVGVFERESFVRRGGQKSQLDGGGGEVKSNHSLERGEAMYAPKHLGIVTKLLTHGVVGGMGKIFSPSMFCVDDLFIRRFICHVTFLNFCQVALLRL